VTPFLWLIVVAVPGVSRTASQQLARETLAWLGVLFSLQIYPVAGSQIWLGSLPQALCAGVMLWDAVVLLSAWSGGIRSGAGGRVPAVRRRNLGALAAQSSATVLGTLAVAGAFAAAIAVTTQARANYRSLTPLDLPGAALMRLPLSQVQLYRKLVRALHQSCDRFVTIAGFNSLYFWSGLEPATTDLVSHRIYLLPVERHTALLDAVEQPGSCLMRVPTMNGVPSDAIVDERAQQRYTLAGKIGPYRLFTGRAAADRGFP
jgi:hypothetical protein